MGTRNNRIIALVYYDGEMVADASLGVIFQSSNTITLSLPRKLSYKALMSKVSEKVPHARSQKLEPLKYRLPTSLEPLHYSIYHVADNADVELMVDTHLQYSLRGPLELFAIFSEDDAVTGVPSWRRADYDFDPNVESPTANLRNDFNLLSTYTTQNDMGASSSHEVPRHSCVAAFDFDLNLPPTQQSTYIPFNIRMAASSSHESLDPFEHLSSGRHSTYIPSRDYVSESLGRHSSAADFNIDFGTSSNERFRDRSRDHRTNVTPTCGLPVDDSDLFLFEGDNSDEEPVQEIGPDGDEVGPFYGEPDDLDEVVGLDDNFADNEEHRLQSDVHLAGSGASNFHKYHPPSHFTTVDVEAFTAVEFPEFPQIEQYNQRGDGELYKGMTFRTKEMAVAAIKNYNIRNSVTSTVYKTAADKYIAVCMNKHHGCNWRVRVSCLKKLNNLWQITKYDHPHTCTSSGLNQHHRNLDVHVLCDALIPMVKINPRITVATCIAAIQSQYGYTVDYHNAWYARYRALQKIFGQWEESYKELRSWLNLMRHHIRGTVVKLETVPAYENDRVVQGVCQFYRLFWTFPQCANAFLHCKPMIQIDGTWLYGRYTQILLLAVAQDGNRRTIPIAFAIVEKEDIDSWEFFLKNLRRHVLSHVMRNRDDGICVISDRGTGIKYALQRLGRSWQPPHIYHRYCLRHIAANYFRKFKNEDERLMVLRMGMSSTHFVLRSLYIYPPYLFNFCFLGHSHFVHEVDELLEEVRLRNNEGYNYLVKIPREKWLRAFDGGRRYGHMTTNLAEAINSSLKGVRHLPITSVVKATYYRLATLFATLGKQAVDWIAGGHTVHPDLRTKFQTFVQHANAMNATCFSREQHLFRVSEYSRPLEGIQHRAYVVNLRERTCDCGVFQTFKYPCAHAIAASSSVRIPYMTFVDPVYLLANVFKVYEHEFPPIGNERDPYFIDDQPTIRPDPALRRKKEGRPRSTRIFCDEDLVEHRERSGQPNLCSICRNPGHTKNKCPTRSGPRIE